MTNNFLSRDHEAYKFTSRLMMILPALILLEWICMRLDIGSANSGIATIIVLTQASSGALHQKMRLRLLGTVMGGLGFLIIYPNFAQVMELALFGFGLWIFVTTLLGELDHGDNYYAYQVANLTIMILAWHTLERPLSSSIIYETINRILQISLAIILLYVFGNIFFPNPIHHMMKNEYTKWINSIEKQLIGKQKAKDLDLFFTELITKIQGYEIEIKANHFLNFDAINENRYFIYHLGKLQCYLLKLSYSLSYHGISQNEFQNDYAKTLTGIYGKTSLNEKLKIAKLFRTEILHDSFEKRLPKTVQNDIINVVDTYIELLHIASNSLSSKILSLKKRWIKRFYHTVHSLALKRALRPLVTMTITALIFYYFKIPDGSTYIVVAVISTLMNARYPDPKRLILVLLPAVITGILISYFYMFIVFPLINTFLIYIVVQLPFWITWIWLKGKKKYNIFATEVAINLIILVPFTNKMDYNLDNFLNTCVTVILSMFTVVLVLNTVFPESTKGIKKSVLRASRYDMIRFTKRKFSDIEQLFKTIARTKSISQIPESREKNNQLAKQLFTLYNIVCQMKDCCSFLSKEQYKMMRSKFKGVVKNLGKESHNKETESFIQFIKDEFHDTKKDARYEISYLLYLIKKESHHE